jgi:hypothetical protein
MLIERFGEDVQESWPAAVAAFRKIQLKAPHLSVGLADITELFTALASDKSLDAIKEELEIESADITEYDKYIKYVATTIGNHFDTFRLGRNTLSLSNDERLLPRAARKRLLQDAARKRLLPHAAREIFEEERRQLEDEAASKTP